MSGIHSLLSVPVIQTLLQCDFVVYGNVVRECFRQDDMLPYLAASVVVAYGPRHMQDVLQRCLFDATIRGPSTQRVRADYTTCTYEVRVDPTTTTRLHVSFVSQFSLLSGSVGSVVDFDVSCLKLDRTGLGLRHVPAWLASHPCPLGQIISACVDGHFSVTNPPDTEDEERFILGRIASMERRGWKHRGCSVAILDTPLTETCAICLTSDGDTSDWVELSCSHAFHLNCFEKYCQTATRRQPLFPRVVACPMCRAATTSCELAPIVTLTFQDSDYPV